MLHAVWLILYYFCRPVNFRGAVEGQVLGRGFDRLAPLLLIQ